MTSVKPNRAVAYSSQITGGSADSEDTSFPVSNALLIDSRSDVFKSLSLGVGGAVAITVQQTTGSGDRMVIVDNHNVPATGSIRVAYSHPSGAQDKALTISGNKAALLDDDISGATSDPIITMTHDPAQSGVLFAGNVQIAKVWDLTNKTRLEFRQAPQPSKVIQETQGGAVHESLLHNRQTWRESLQGLLPADGVILTEFQVATAAGGFYYFHDFGVADADFHQVRHIAPVTWEETVKHKERVSFFLGELF